MRNARTVVSVCAFVVFVLAGLMVSNGQQAPAGRGQGQQGQQAQAAPPRMPVLHAMNLIMKPDDATATGGGPVFGTATQTGVYITRNRFAPNVTSRPHYHTADR